MSKKGKKNIFQKVSKIFQNIPKYSKIKQFYI